MQPVLQYIQKLALAPDEKEQHLYMLLDALPVAVYTTDSNGRITFFNRSAAALWGRAPIIGQDMWCGCYRVYDTDGTPLPRDQYPVRITLAGNRPLRGIEALAERQDGTRFSFTSWPTPLYDRSGSLIGAVNMLMDITEIKKTTAVLEQARIQANAANVAKSEFLANMSHEFRTPMNVIVGLVSILKKTDLLPEKKQKILNTLSEESDRMMSLINNLLDITKIENDVVELQNIPFDLAQLLEEIVSIQNVVASEKDLVLHIDYISGPQNLLIGDPLRLKQALLNIVGNAIKFTRTGSVTLRVDCRMKNETNAILSISVKDTGIGIREDQIEHIFSKFTQADTSSTRRFGGTGIGLAISKTLIEKMGGTLDVNSIYGCGSCFTITVPMQCNIAGWPEPQLPLEQPPQRTGNGAHILIVDDYPPNIALVSFLLDEIGCTFSIAENGEDAVRQTENRKFDLILMDVQMPVMDGLKATRIIREREKQRKSGKSNIIGMTAHALKGDRERCFGAGMNEYISKPFTPEELQKKVTRFVAAQRAH